MEREIVRKREGERDRAIGVRVVQSAHTSIHTCTPPYVYIHTYLYI